MQARSLFPTLLIAATFLCGSSFAHAKSAFDRCVEQAADSKEIVAAEQTGGRLGADEYVIEKCGHNPTTRSNQGALQLTTKDCSELFNWAKSEICDPSLFSTQQYLFTKHLNPTVFREKQYVAACNEMTKPDIAFSFRRFEQMVCTAPQHPSTKRH